MTATPKKAGPSNGVGTAQRVRLPVVKTPATVSDALFVHLISYVSPNRLA